MSHSVKITAAGNKISAFVKSKGGDSSRVDQGISKSNKALKDNEGSDGHGDAADATVATLEAVLGSIDNFKSGDPTQIAIGVLDIVAEVSAFASLAGPTGEIVAAVVGPLCSFISVLLGAGTKRKPSTVVLEPPESDEDMMKRVVHEALAASKYQDLRATASGVTKVLKENMEMVQLYLDKADKLGSGDRDFIRSDSFQSAGSEFLGTLRSHIQTDLATADHVVAARTAKLITAYSSVVFVRCKYLYMLSSLLGGDLEAQTTAIVTKKLADDQRETSNDLLRPFLKIPNTSNHLVWTKRFFEPQSSLDLIQAICYGKRSNGKLVAIFNTRYKQYLSADGKQDDANCRIMTKEQQVFQDMPLTKKFVVFGPYGNGHDYLIFSPSAVGYVYAMHPLDEARRYVHAYKTKCFPIDYFQFSDEGNGGSVRLRNTTNNEYMYSSEHLNSEGVNPLYTWKPGEVPYLGGVEQGRFIFEDFVRPKNTTRIRSVSSGNYLDGRATINVGLNQIQLTAPRSDHLQFFDWELIKLDNGTYNIKSVTSNMYIDGRDKGIGDGEHVQLFHLTSKVARNHRHFMWHIKKYTYEGRTRYAIQSDTSKLYLDGTSGNKKFPCLTGRNPQGDKWLMWELDLE